MKCVISALPNEIANDNLEFFPTHPHLLLVRQTGSSAPKSAQINKTVF